MKAGLSVNTRAVYGQALDLFARFRAAYDFNQTWPAPMSHWETFISYLFHQGYAYRTASTYISALRFKHKLMGFNNDSYEVVISKMLEGYRRSKTAVKDTRLPITYELLSRVCLELEHICDSRYEILLFRAAYTLAFFGLFRVGELVFSSSDMANRPLFLSDLKDFVPTREFTVYLRRSKTNQSGPPTPINIVAIGTTSCPVSAMQAYLRVRPTTSPSSPLFCHSNGSPLNRYQFGAVLGRVIRTLGLAGAHYRSHSFRIGAATWLAHKGVPHHDIQRMGRWTSNAFRHYLR